MKMITKINYRNILRDYYQELTASISESQSSESNLCVIYVKGWDKILSIISKFPTPEKETKFVQTVLALSGQSLKQVA